jgi:hypothetical protein
MDGQCSWQGEDDKYIQKLPKGKKGLPQQRCKWEDNIRYTENKQSVMMRTGLNKPVQEYMQSR